jgi:hypothetical protein
MNKIAIKNYATGARRKLMEAVTQKMFLYGFDENMSQTDKEAEKYLADSGVFLDTKQKEARRNLSRRIQNLGYKNVVEEVAYTWFNRFIALRFMEVNGYLPSGVRILSSESEGRLEPDCVREWERLDYIKHDEAVKHKAQGDEALYRYILISQCNALGKILPHMFSAISDYAELLLPDRLYTKDGIIYDLTNPKSIEEEDFFDQVEIIGWLYQYYISEKKDEVFASLKKNVKITKENIPAATQLFTPEWIVKYMVENSLGRLWLESHPNDALKANWNYYIDEAEQTPEVNECLSALRTQNLVNKPEDIKFIDPCMGSGHILVYAFDVLMQIYESVGYSTRDAVRLIVEKNIYGLDIDERAHQLAYFAIMMKARQYDRRFFTHDVTPNVYAIMDSNELGGEYRHEMGNFLLREEHRNTLNYLLKAFANAKEYGSILKLENRDYEGLLDAWLTTGSQTAGNFNLTLWYTAVEKAVPDLVRQAILLTQKYDVVVTNPPYMGSSGMSAKLSEFVKKNYPDSKSDMSTVFMEQTLSMCKARGYMSMINIPVWMFILNYESLRGKLLSNQTLVNMLHFGRGIFGADFGTTAFVFSRGYSLDYCGQYRRLYLRHGSVDTPEQKEIWFRQGIGRYFKRQSVYSMIPGRPIAYWITDVFANSFKNKNLGDYAEVITGMTTGDNTKYLRLWHETDSHLIAFHEDKMEILLEKHKYWIPYSKGGARRNWYGNYEYVVNWSKKDEFNRSKTTLQRLYLREAVTWPFVTSGMFSARYLPIGFLWDVAGSPCFFQDESTLKYALALLCSKVADTIIKIINPTINVQAVDLAKIPVIMSNRDDCISNIIGIANHSIAISRTDWDAFETSWDFKTHSLIAFRGNWEEAEPLMGEDDITQGAVVTKWSKTSPPIAQAFYAWERFADEQFYKLKSNEEELNRIFIDIYGLQDELTPEVEDKDVTVRRADLGREIRSFVSYAVGCMFGRYSLDREGLVFAGGEWKYDTRTTTDEAEIDVMSDTGFSNSFNQTNYASFRVEDDNILPITDNDYFEDDIVGRFVEFVKVIYGADTLTANLDFIADALYPDGKGTARERIRRYFLNDFYKDHVKIYQKKPIYWQFDSGKQNGFKALVYLHRYNRFTVAQVRTEYLHPLQRKYEAEVERLNALSMLDETTTREKAEYKKQTEKLVKQIAECRAYDPIIAHIALKNIELDLDDGVTVNYLKFQDVEVASGDSRPPIKMNLLTKIF